MTKGTLIMTKKQIPDNTLRLPKSRESNFELLRIVSMLLIIAHHYSVHGAFSFENDLLLNRFVVQMLSLGGKLGVNLFVLITGYFLSTQKNFRWKSIALFVIQVTLFSVLINGTYFAFNYTIFGIKPFIKCIFPLLFDGWWFAKTYFVLMLIAPFINLFVNKASKKDHFGVIALLFFIWCIIPTFTTSAFESNELVWFVFLYILAAYIRKYPQIIFDNSKIQIILLLVSSLFIWLSVLVFDILGTRYTVFSNYTTYFSGMQKLPVVIQSCALFCLFKNLKIKNSTFINTISATTFGIYLLHDNSIIRKLLWIGIFQNAKYQSSPWLIVHAMLSIVLVFVACSAISFLYNITVKKAAKWSIDKLYHVFKRQIAFLRNKVASIINIFTA